MKNKTMLKFLLCFLIVGMGLNLAKVEAATGSSQEVYTEACQSCSGRVTNGTCSSGPFVMKYDGKNYHLSDKWICPTCVVVINSGAWHDDCGKMGQQTMKIDTCVCGGDIIVSTVNTNLIRCTNGSLTTPKKDGNKYVCGAVTKCSAEGCGGYIVNGMCSTGKAVGTYNKRSYHYSSKWTICRMCSPVKLAEGYSCGQHPTYGAVLEIGKCECGGDVLAEGTDVLCSYSNTVVKRSEGKYKCQRAILNENPGWTAIKYNSNSNGTHNVILENAIGETKVETENCYISVAGNYVSNKNGTHSITTKCSKCNWEKKTKYCESCGNEFPFSESKCTDCNEKLKYKSYQHTYNCSKDSSSVRKLDASKHEITYKCNTCKGTWSETEYHTWLDGKCRYCTARPSEIDNPSSGGPSAKPFFQTGAILGVDYKIKSLFEWNTDTVKENVSPVKHILGLIMMVGTYAGVIIMAVYAIMWMTATPAKRQDLKAGMIPLTLGIILLMVGPRLAILIVEALL